MRSRRFWLIVFLAVSFIGLLLGSFIVEATFQTLIQSIVGAYLISSYGEKRLVKK